MGKTAGIADPGLALPPGSAEQTGVNLKRAKKYMTTKLIISGGKLAQPSAPFSLYADEFLDEQFGLGQSASPTLHLELGWIDEQGNVVGANPTDELLGMEFDPAFVRPLMLFEQLGLRAIEFRIASSGGRSSGLSVRPCCILRNRRTAPGIAIRTGVQHGGACSSIRKIRASDSEFVVESTAERGARKLRAKSPPIFEPSGGAENSRMRLGLVRRRPVP